MRHRKRERERERERERQREYEELINLMDGRRDGWIMNGRIVHSEYSITSECDTTEIARDVVRETRSFPSRGEGEGGSYGRRKRNGRRTVGEVAKLYLTVLRRGRKGGIELTCSSRVMLSVVGAFATNTP